MIPEAVAAILGLVLARVLVAHLVALDELGGPAPSRVQTPNVVDPRVIALVEAHLVAVLPLGGAAVEDKGDAVHVVLRTRGNRHAGVGVIV